MIQFYESTFRYARESIDVSYFQGKKILITGANGLIASHMAYSLIAARRESTSQFDLTLVSRSAPPEWLKKTFSEPGIRVLEHDLSLGLPAQIKSETFDVIIHAATYGQPKKFIDRPLETLHLNARLTEELLQNLVSSKGDFLFMSSSEIYGSPPASFSPLKEDFPGMASTLDQRAVYTSSKRYGETLCKVYGEQFGVRARIARISSVYGPGIRLNDDRAIYVFIRKALTEGVLQLQDPGQQVRRWLDIGDSLKMLFFITCRSESLVYNVAGEDLKSISDLAHMITEKTGSRLLIPNENQNQYNTIGAPTLIDIDINKIRIEAGLQGQLRNLSQIVDSSIDWTRKLLATT